MRERPLGLPLTALALFGVVALATTFALATPPLVDFKIFYCGGRAQSLGLDPYVIGSLHACEAARHALPAAVPADVTYPADLPNYALAFAAAFAVLPYDAAAVAYLVLGLIAAWVAARDLRELAGTGTLPIALALGLGTVWLFAFLGQPLVFMLAALVRAALELERGRPRRAALYAGAMMLQPHVGIAVLFALFVAQPRARPAALAVALAVALALATQPAQSLDYALHVLPFAALVHASNFANLGTAWILHGAGLPAALAVRLGGAAGLAATVAAAFVARSAARRYAAPSLVVLLPPAFALAFGVYEHVQQAAFVVPAALVMWTRSPRPNPPALIALVALAVPWLVVGASWRFDAAMLVVTLGLARTLGAGKRAEIVTYAGTVALIALGAIGIGYHAVPRGALARVHATDPRLDAQASVAAGNAFERIDRPAVLWALKAPTWAGYLAAIGAALGGPPAPREPGSTGSRTLGVPVRRRSSER